MKLLDILNEPWLITQTRLDEIVDTYMIHLKGEKIDIPGLEAKMGVPFQSRQQEGYEVVDGIAIIDVEDVLSKKLNFFTLLFGGTSYMQVEDNVRMAVADNAVKGVILRVDSPGGTVDGAFESADAIAGLRDKKPMASFSTGMIASGAYLLGSATGRIVLSSESVQAGSIGVRTNRRDFSKALENAGIIIHDISSGKQKSLGAPHKPMSDEERDIIKMDVDHMAQLFFNTVHKNMGLSVEDIKALEGGVLRGSKAVKAGLVEGISTLDVLIASMSGGSPGKGNGGNSSVKKTKNKLEVKGMNEDELKAQHSGLYNDIVAKAQKGLVSEEVVKAKVEEGVTAESGRLSALDKLSADMPGHEKMIADFKTDRTISAANAALQIVAAHGEKLKGIAAAQTLDAEGLEEVPSTDGGGGSVTAKGFEALVAEYQTEHECKKSVAIKAIVASHKKEHAAYIVAQNQEV